jgi:hypothetical protein
MDDYPDSVTPEAEARVDYEPDNSSEEMSLGELIRDSKDILEDVQAFMLKHYGEDTWSHVQHHMIKARQTENAIVELLCARAVISAVRTGEESGINEQVFGEDIKHARILSSLLTLDLAAEYARKTRDKTSEEIQEEALGMLAKLLSVDGVEDKDVEEVYGDAYAASRMLEINALLNGGVEDHKKLAKRLEKIRNDLTATYPSALLREINLFIDKETGTKLEAIRGVEYAALGLREEGNVATKLFLADNLFCYTWSDVKDWHKNPKHAEERRVSAEALVKFTDGYDFIMNAMNDAQAEEANASETGVTELSEVKLDTFKPMEVEWEVLPPGQLLDYAKEIVDGLMGRNKEHIPPAIDPRRLRTLEKVREQWGADNAYYMKGALKRRHKMRDNTKECPDQYIVLILQEKGKDGGIVEHAVAESPIAGPHALYVYRQDVNPELTWRDIMSQNKADARKMGARPVKHPSGVENGELVEIMTERVGALLEATPEEFLRIEFSGKYVRIKNELAIKAFIALANKA